MRLWSRLGFTVAAVLLVFAAAAWAGEDMAALRARAEQGDAQAQFNLGEMYRTGEGVAQDYKEAAAWFRKAADQGDAQAQLNLGVMYYEYQTPERI